MSVPHPNFLHLLYHTARLQLEACDAHPRMGDIDVQDIRLRLVLQAEAATGRILAHDQDHSDLSTRARAAFRELRKNTDPEFWTNAADESLTGADLIHRIIGFARPDLVCRVA